MRGSLARPPELGGQPLPPPPSPTPGWRGFPANSQGDEPVISPQAGQPAGREPPGIRRPCFLLAQAPCPSSGPEASRPVQATLSVLSCLILITAASAGPRTPRAAPRQPLLTPGMPVLALRVCFFLSDSCHLPHQVFLPVPAKAGCSLLGSTDRNQQHSSACLCVHWSPLEFISPWRAGTLCLLFTAQGLDS